MGTTKEKRTLRAMRRVRSTIKFANQLVGTLSTNQITVGLQVTSGVAPAQLVAPVAGAVTLPGTPAGK